MLRAKSVLRLAAMLWPSLVLAGEPCIISNPSAKKGEPLLIVDTGAGCFHYIRNDWAPVTLLTPRQVEKPSKEFPWIAATDPFLFASRIGENPVIYWGAGDVSARVVREYPKEGEGLQTAIVALSAARDGLRKEAFLSIRPGEAVVYVTCRLTAEQPVNASADAVCFLAAARPGEEVPWKVELDGLVAQPGTKERLEVKRTFYWSRPAQNVACAIIVDEADRCPDDLVRARMFCYRSETSLEMRLTGRGIGPLKQGQTVMTRHILLWGDGDLRARTKDLAEDLAAGKLESAFYLPGVGQ